MFREFMLHILSDGKDNRCCTPDWSDSTCHLWVGDAQVPQDNEKMATHLIFTARVCVWGGGAKCMHGPIEVLRDHTRPCEG